MKTPQHLSFSCLLFFLKKKRRMRILGTVFFLSFLAGKLKTFERILVAENKKNLAHAYF